MAASANLYLDAKGVADPKASRIGPKAAAIPGAPAAWVQLARDGEWRRRLGTAALQRANALSWDATVTQFLAVAEEAIAIGAPRAAA